jgi:hypothetical protein
VAPGPPAPSRRYAPQRVPLTCARNSADDGPQSAGRGRRALANSSILRRSSGEALPVTAARVTIAAGLNKETNLSERSDTRSSPPPGETL